MSTVEELRPATPPAKYLYRVPDAVVLLSLRRSTIYELIRSGRLRTVQEGATRLIPASALTEYVELLKSEAAGRTTYREAC